MDVQEMSRALDTAKSLGALGAELLFTEDRGVWLEMDGHKVGKPQDLHEARVDVRVWTAGGREGRADGDPGTVDQLVEQAILAAGEAAEDPTAGPLQRQAGVIAGLSIRDRRHDQLAIEDRADVLALAERSASQHDARVRTGGFRYRDRERTRRFVSSRGVTLEEVGTTYLAEGEVTVGSPEGTIRLWESIASRSFASIASLPFGTSLARRATELLVDGERIPAGPVRVVLPARVVASIFAWVATHFTSNVLDDPDAFFLGPGDKGIDPRLHLLDDGTIPGGLRSRSFDDRGAVPIPLTMVREGAVDGRFLGIDDARRRELPPTGHRRGTRLLPSNLILKSGTRSVSASSSDLGGLSLIVDSLPGLPQVDPRTGDLDTKVNGIVMQGNERVGAMRDVPLRGNLGTVLRSVLEVCSDTDRVGHVDAPALIVEGFELP